MTTHDDRFNKWENEIVAESYDGNPRIFYANLNIAHKFKVEWGKNNEMSRM